MIWIRVLGAIIVAYVLGSLPTGYAAGRLLKNVDVRKIGSGRTGGTNVLRAAGVVPAALTIVGDWLKGYVAVWLAHMIAPGTPFAGALAGLAAVIGHNYSAFLNFHGGAGTMTTLGAAVALMPSAAGAAALGGLAVILLLRYASLGSLTLAALLIVICVIGVLRGIWPAPFALFAVGTSALSTWKLRPNIQRLYRGTERKIGEPPQPLSSLSPEPQTTPEQEAPPTNPPTAI